MSDYLPSNKIITKRLIPALCLIPLLFLTACADSQSLDIPSANPEQHSEPKPLSWWSRAAMQLFLDGSVAVGSRSGFIAAFARDGQVIHATTAGFADLENQLPMTLDTKVRIASMTKPITAVAAHILIEEGRLRLDDPVADYIPLAATLRVASSESRVAGEFPTQALDQPLRVRHLLMFASGIGSGDESGTELEKLWGDNNLHQLKGSLQQRVETILQLPLFEQPGVRWRYGGSADVMARVIEVASGQPYDQFLQQRIFTPLAMNNTGFLPLPDQQQGLAKVYTQNEGSDLVLAPKRIDEVQAWTPGGGGLVSTVGDYMRFALMLWNRGSYDGVKILKPETIERMTSVHITDGVLASQGIAGHGWGLGMAVVDDASATQTVDRDGDFWWAGYFGTTFFVSPETGLVAVVMSQNEPGPYSGLPFHVHLAPSFAFWGM